MLGTIVREFLPKGFCFVVGDDNHREYFLHANEFEGEWSCERIRKGVKVEFTPESGEKGLRAKRAKLA